MPPTLGSRGTRFTSVTNPKTWKPYAKKTVRLLASRSGYLETEARLPVFFIAARDLAEMDKTSLITGVERA